MSKRIVVAQDPLSNEITLIIKDHLTFNFDRANKKCELTLSHGKYNFEFEKIELQQVHGGLRFRDLTDRNLKGNLEFTFVTSNSFTVFHNLKSSYPRVYITNSNSTQTNVLWRFLEWYGGCLLDSVNASDHKPYTCENSNFSLFVTTDDLNNESKKLYYKNVLVESSMAYNSQYKIFDMAFKSGSTIWYSNLPASFNREFKFFDIELIPLRSIISIDLIALCLTELCSLKQFPAEYITV